MRQLILGYGNQDRQDDGVAWHILNEVMHKLNIPAYQEIEENFDSQADLVFVFQLQLMPEFADEIAKFERVCFIDAHTGAVPENIHFECISPLYEHSPLTHHLTAKSLLSIIRTIYNKVPDAILVSVKGHKFGYTTELSPETARLVTEASHVVIDWLRS